MSNWACVSSLDPETGRFPGRPPSKDRGWPGAEDGQLFWVPALLSQVATRFEKLQVGSLGASFLAGLIHRELALWDGQ